MRPYGLALHNRTSNLWTGWVEATTPGQRKPTLATAPVQIEPFSSGWLSWRVAPTRALELRLIVAHRTEREGSDPVTEELLLEFPAGLTEAIVFLEEPREGRVVLRAVYVW